MNGKIKVRNPKQPRPIMESTKTRLGGNIDPRTIAMIRVGSSKFPSARVGSRERRETKVEVGEVGTRVESVRDNHGRSGGGDGVPGVDLVGFVGV